MTIDVTPNHFTAREQAILDIRSDGLFLVEAALGPEDLSATPHVHPYRVDIYILEGMMELHEPGTGLAHLLNAGTRAVVPADTLHWERSPARFRACFGVSEDPDIINAARAAPPA